MIETKDDDDDNVQLVPRKRKENAQKQAFLAPKKARVTKTTLATKKKIIPYEIPRRIKTRSIEANPKIANK